MQKTLMCLVAMLLPGCLKGEPQPFDDNRIVIVSNTLIESASVTFPDGLEVTLPPKHFELFRTLFRTLAPIEIEQVKAIPGLPGKADYRLALFVPGDVANIRVMINDSKLIWTLDGFQYQGGDAKAFGSAVKMICATSTASTDG